MALLYRIDGTTQPETLEDCLSCICDNCCYTHLMAVEYFPCATKIIRCQVMNLLFEVAPKDENGHYIDTGE